MTTRTRRIGLSAGVLVGTALVVYACGPSLIGGGGLDGPVVRSGFSLASDGEDAEVKGIIRLDGECLYLENPEVADVRYPVVWPRRTSWQDEPAGVVLPDGEVALLGAAVYGGGGYHADPDRIESVAGADGAALAMRCAQEPHREVAVFNPGSDVDVTG